jgi:hypothetical protein
MYGLVGQTIKFAKKGGLTIPRFAIEVPAYQSLRLRIGHKDMMSSDMPDIKESVATVEHRSSVDFKASLLSIQRCCDSEQ